MLTIVAMVVVAVPASCPHRYFPIEEGLTLTYRAGRQELTVHYSEVTRAEGTVKGKMSVQVKDKDRKGETEAICSSEGIKTTLGGLEGIAIAASGLDAKVVSSDGVALPPEDALRKRQPWKNALSVELRPPMKSMPLKIAPVIKTSFHKEAVVVGEEKVTVGSTTYKALKVKNITTAVGNGPDAERSLESTLWIAPGIGIIKVMTGGHVDLELLEVIRPGRTSQRPEKEGARHGG